MEQVAPLHNLHNLLNLQIKQKLNASTRVSAYIKHKHTKNLRQAIITPRIN